MNKTYSLIGACIIAFTLYSCSKKSTPSETAASNPDSAMVKKPAAMPKPKPLTTVPKVIVVNDASAKKSIDGRLYYDLQGHRYWRNNKNGKYYLYNKSMHADEAYKAPAKKL